MEKRLLLAFVLSAVVLYAFRTYLFPEPPASAPITATQSASSSAPPATAPSTAPAAPAPAPPSAQASQAPVEPKQAAVVTGNIHADNPENVVVDTSLYIATLSNVGGELRSFKLKDYTDSKDKPIELIDQAGASRVGYPLSTATLDPKLDASLNSSNFKTERTGNRVKFEYSDGSVHAEKTIDFEPDQYSLTIETTLTRDGKPVPHNVVWQGGFGDQSIAYNAAKYTVAYPNDANYKTIYLGSIKDPQEMTVPRIGMQDQYFLAMFILPQSEPAKIHKETYKASDNSDRATIALGVPDPDSMPIRIYVGPRATNWLVKTDPQLASVIDYGYSSFIAKPLLVALLWIHSYISNFGWDIILLTLAINFALFPLRMKQQTSMQKMQKIQPKMKTLQDKFKKLKANDPRRMEVQSEMMNLYKEHGINPMSGCLPLLLQMPFLYGIWSMLTNSIEMRHAPWAFWIHDLSLADPYYVMPIVMAVSMIAMQRMTPTTVDPAQAKMMMVMPIMFAFIFRTYQSGLMLYWLTGNLVGVGQQFFINKYWSPLPVKKDNKKLADRNE